MRLIMILCGLLFSIALQAQAEEQDSQEKTSTEILNETLPDPDGFEPRWDYEMIAKGGNDKGNRFSLVYDSIEAEHLDIFLTDLQGSVIETFWSNEPKETGLFVTFSISKTPLDKGVYYLNVVTDGRAREAARIEVD